MRRGLVVLAALLLLAACAFADLPVTSEPAGQAATVRWQPAGPPRAILLALHGFNDSRNAFEEFGPAAAAKGVLVEAYDQHGFGARPDRGRWQGTAVMAEEARARVRALRAEHPGVPVFVLGESMGAAVTTVAFSGADGALVDGVVLSAPAVWGGRSFAPLYRRVLTLANLVAPGFTLTGRGLKIQASDNIAALIRLGRDPLYIRKTRIDAIAGLVHLMDQARGDGRKLAMPTLVLTGARDQVVPATSQEEFVRSLPPGRCTAVTYLYGWHLLLRDLERQRVYDDILAWVLGQPLPSGLDRPCQPAGTAGV